MPPNDLPVTNPPSTTPAAISQTPTLPPTSNHRTKAVIFILAIALVITVGALIYTVMTLMSRSSEQVYPTPTPLLNQSATNSRFVYYKDDQLRLKLSDGTDYQLAAQQNIDSFAFDENYVVYVAGEKKQVSSGSSYIEPNSVYLLALKSPQASPVKIYEEPYRPSVNSDYVTSIKSVSLSPDSSLIGITTADAFKTYAIETQTLTTIFTKPVTQVEKGTIYAYRDALFSPDNSKAVLMVGYYEGAKYSLVDLTTQQITELPYQYYVSGEQPIGWKDANTLIVVDFTSSEFDGGESEMVVNYVRVLDLSKQTAFKYSGNYVRASVGRNKIYFVSEMASSPTSKIQKVYEFDMATSTIKELYALQSVNEQGGIGGIADLRSLGSTLLITQASYASNPMAFQIVILNAGKQIETVDGATFAGNY